MLRWLNERILHITRTLEYGLFQTAQMKAQLNAELSKLLKMREKYHEHKKKEKQEKMDSYKW